MAPIPQGRIDVSKDRIKHAPRAMVGFVQLGSVGLHDLLNRPLQQLAGRYPALSDQSLLACGLPEIQLKFTFRTSSQWPGYEPYNYIEKVSLAGAKCNGQVATAVAEAVQSLLQRAMRAKPYESTYAILPGSQYTIQNLALVGLRHVQGDIFIAEFEIPRRMA
ncbi:hypothetical protein BN946_scf184938.g32 [Trametes cinnabarina]|uniref:Uncharacterized protein n=1 Tax=Pycnoporus cinnabarinus TaxID=5643 RepID=A0A060S1L0_PYCCI|nr:hypothetical protein BN946_scf184938.g32 [Trametes cinnabarina]